MNNHIQLVLKSSTTELSLNDRELGIYVVPQLDGLTGLPEIRTTSGVNSGYDGGWTSAQNYDARSITIRGVIANEDVATVERLRRQLVSLAGQGKNEELTLDLVTEAGNSYTLQVRTIALEMAMQRVLKQQEFMLQLRADDPLIYDNSEQTHEALIQVAKATGGFRIDFALPLAIDGGSEETVVSNEGLEEVPTITRMYGALHNPKIINHTTNQSMQITADLGYAQGEPINPRDAEGSTIAIDDAIEAPFNNIELLGNTEQTTYSGKNLFGLRDSTTLNGVSFTHNADGTFNLSGTATADTEFSLVMPKPAQLVNGVQVSLSTNKTNTGVRYYFHSTNSTGGWSATLFYLMDTATVRTGNLSNPTTEYVKAVVQVLKNTTVNASNITVQLELGQPTAFEPYVGGTASPNPDYPQTVKTTTGRQVVEVRGKNMFNGVHYRDGYIISSTGAETASANGWISQPIAVNPNTTYTVSYSTTDAIYGMRVGEYDRSGTFLARPVSYSPTSFTFTTSANTYFVKLSTSTSFSNIQLELGNSKSDFEPYQGYSHEINLGKNLFDTSDTPTYIDASTSMTADGNGFKLTQNHTASGTWSAFVEYTINKNRLEPNTTYTLSVKATKSGTNFTGAGGLRTHINGTYGTVSSTGSITFTTPATINSVGLLFYLAYNSTQTGTGSVAFHDIQLELGSTPSEYAPYIQSWGSNLLDKSQFEATTTRNGITFTNNGNGTITLNGTATANASYRILGYENDQKPIAGDYLTGGVSSSVRLRAMNKTGSSYTVLGSSEGNTVKLNRSTYTTGYIEISVLNGTTVSNMVITPMLTMTEEETKPLELCKLGTYQDYIYKDNGKWYVHKEVGKVVIANPSWAALQGTSAETTAISSNGAFALFWTGSGTTAINGQIVSNYLKWEQQTVANNAAANNMIDGTCVQRSGTNDRLYYRNTALIGKTGVQLTAITQNLTIYYVLATPTDTEITYEPLIEQLNNLQWGGTLKGTNNISVDSPELEGILDLSYFTDRNPDRRDEIVIDSRLKTITLNGLDIYNLKTEGSEFLTLAPGENKLSLQSDINGDNGYAEISYKQGYLSI